MGHREGDGAEFLLDLPPKDERPLIEQHVTALTVDIGKEHGLDQPVAVVEGGELHRLVLQGVDRLGGGEHPRHQDVPPTCRCSSVLGQSRNCRKPSAWSVHGVGVGDEAEGGVLLAPPPLGRRTP